MAATARRLVASSILYLNRMKRVQFPVTLPIALHHSASRRHFSVASPEQSGLFQSGKSSLTPIHLLSGKKGKKESSSQRRLGDGSGPCSDKFHEWHNGRGTLHESASIDSSAVVEIGAVVHSKAVVEANVHIGSGTIVGPSVIIGHSTKIGYNVALSNCQVGELCVVHNGVSIGQDGFGFYVDGNGNMIKKPQTLNVIIGAHVEIGANTCIDRGSWRDTIIGDYTKLDNLVQIGHNVVMGKNCMICGQVGIAGSATIGDYVTMGGRVAVRDHVSIASKVRLAATSCVTKDIQEPGDYGGFPAVPIHEWRRQVISSCRTTRKRSP